MDICNNNPETGRTLAGNLPYYKAWHGHFRKFPSDVAFKILLFRSEKVIL